MSTARTSAPCCSHSSAATCRSSSNAASSTLPNRLCIWSPAKNAPNTSRTTTNSTRSSSSWAPARSSSARMIGLARSPPRNSKAFSKPSPHSPATPARSRAMAATSATTLRLAGPMATWWNSWSAFARATTKMFSTSQTKTRFEITQTPTATCDFSTKCQPTMN